ncbi:DUF4330 family protein [Halobacteria archaeon HArc-gm2]|nr:DUF4330 family protein [Halobacteria archaeon HArc-gm2]
MEILDEKGRLFGVVNVVDALVVLLVLAVVAAGVALVVGGQNSPDAGGTNDTDSESTRYATLSYIVPYESSAATLQDNDTVRFVDGGEYYNVSDVYRSFTPSGSVHVVTTVAYDEEFTANGNQLYGGQSTQLTTGSYRVTANTVAVNQSTASIPTQQVPVVLSANVTSSVAQAVAEGQEATIGNETVATVESVRRGETNGDRQQVWLGVELRAWDRTTGPVFDGQSLRVDNPVTVVTDTVVVRGRLHEVGTTELPEPADS